MLVSTIVGFDFTRASAVAKGVPVKQSINTSQQVSLDACCPKPKKNTSIKQNSLGLSVIA